MFFQVFVYRLSKLYLFNHIYDRYRYGRKVREGSQKVTGTALKKNLSEIEIYRFLNYEKKYCMSHSYVIHILGL